MTPAAQAIWDRLPQRGQEIVEEQAARRAAFRGITHDKAREEILGRVVFSEPRRMYGTGH